MTDDKMYFWTDHLDAEDLGVTEIRSPILIAPAILRKSRRMAKCEELAMIDRKYVGRIVSVRHNQRKSTLASGGAPSFPDAITEQSAVGTLSFIGDEYIVLSNGANNLVIHADDIISVDLLGVTDNLYRVVA